MSGRKMYGVLQRGLKGKHEAMNPANTPCANTTDSYIESIKKKKTIKKI